MRGEKKSRFLRTAVLGLGLAVVAIFTILPSAAAQAPQPTAGAAATSADIDLSSVPKIKSYLRSLGVDSTGVVIQRGAKNYAGPNCPSVSWNCTTARKVVQLSPATASNDDDHENRFVCRRDRGAGTVTKDDSPPVQSCFILQPGGSSNQATCDMQTFGSTGTISQTCFITQGGASNNASARLVAGMGSNGGDQNILQRIEIKQTGGSSGNTLNASETAVLGAARNAGGAAAGAFQDFNQVICGNQQASGTGFNTATVKQQGAAAAVFSNAADVLIEQNRDSVPSTCTEGTATTPGAAPFADPFVPALVPPHDPVSCPVASDSFGNPKLEANTCSRIQQDAASGRNRVTRQDQTNLLFASVNGAANVDIEQGTFDGGMDSTQDQESTGVSSIVDVQDVDQITTVRNATGFVDIREIEDPRCCAGGHQLGNPSNTWSLGQDLTQRAFVNGILLDPDVFTPGVSIFQDGADYGNCTSSGNCTVNQRVSNNVETRTQSDSGMTVDIFFDCTAGSFGESLRIAGTAGILLEGSTCATQHDFD